MTLRIRPEDQHAEGRDGEHLRQEPHGERAPEGVGDGVGDDFEVGFAEEDEAEADAEQSQEDPGEPGHVSKREEHRRQRRGGGFGWDRYAGGAEGVDVTGDLPARLSHLAPVREQAARHIRPGVQRDVAVHRDEVAGEAAEEVGVAAQDEDVALV